MRLGFYYVMSVPYAAGLACFGGPMIGGYRLTGWVFAIMLAVAPFVLVLDRTPGRFPAWIWLPWVLVVILSLSWAGDVSLHRVQDVCTIITPLVIAPIASRALKTLDEVKTLARSFIHCLLILLAGLILNVTAGVVIIERPMAMTAAITGCVFVSQIRERPLVSLLGWSGSLLIAFLTGGRMATFVILLEWLILPRFRRQLARILVAGIVSALAVGLFYTHTAQQRFFPGDRGTLGDVKEGDFFSSGRFEAWPQLWEEIVRRPLLGAGAHASAQIVDGVWEGVTHPHNDYLRILLDQGFVGLTFFLLGVLGQLVVLWNRGFSGGSQVVTIRSAAYMGIFVLLITAATDNPIVYGVWFMHPLFVLIGASYAPAAVTPEDQTDPRSTHRARRFIESSTDAATRTLAVR